MTQSNSMDPYDSEVYTCIRQHRCLGTDHLNFWGGGGAWVIFGETVFFFSSAGKPGNFFLDRLKDRIFFFEQSESSFFFYNHMNHHQLLIRTCISNFSFINLV